MSKDTTTQTHLAAELCKNVYQLQSIDQENELIVFSCNLLLVSTDNWSDEFLNMLLAKFPDLSVTVDLNQILKKLNDEVVQALSHPKLKVV